MTKARTDPKCDPERQRHSLKTRFRRRPAKKQNDHPGIEIKDGRHPSLFRHPGEVAVDQVQIVYRLAGRLKPLSVGVAGLTPTPAPWCRRQHFRKVLPYN